MASAEPRLWPRARSAAQAVGGSSAPAPGAIASGTEPTGQSCPRRRGRRPEAVPKAFVSPAGGTRFRWSSEVGGRASTPRSAAALAAREKPDRRATAAIDGTRQGVRGRLRTGPPPGGTSRRQLRPCASVVGTGEALQEALGRDRVRRGADRAGHGSVPEPWSGRSCSRSWRSWADPEAQPDRHELARPDGGGEDGADDRVMPPGACSNPAAPWRQRAHRRATSDRARSRPQRGSQQTCAAGRTSPRQGNPCTFDRRHG